MNERQKRRVSPLAEVELEALEAGREWTRRRIERNLQKLADGQAAWIWNIVEDRFKRTGQFWTPLGKRYLLALDLARRNNDWDEVWDDRLVA